MRMYDIIKKKRDGEILSNKEIDFFVSCYTNGTIPDYQAAALCMAIYFNCMTSEETAALTFAMRDSGYKLSLKDVKGLRVDKHSTGGVGDKTSLVVIPIVASCGIKIAKMSGRGLGHTGGTVDKLEAIEGFCTDVTTEEFEKTVNSVGASIVGQSATLAPADKLLYALRDVTATVDSIPLIASSIMSKKLAADDDCIVLDVKTGSGSFMKTLEESRKLAKAMVDIGKKANKKILALITDMDSPLGNAIGNSLEVIEAVDTLSGKGPADLYLLSVELAANMLFLAEKGSYDDCLGLAKDAISSGRALEKFIQMVKAQGGNTDYIKNTANFPLASLKRDVVAAQTGYISYVNAEEYGRAALILGAGRNAKDDIIDHSAGILLKAKTGQFVKQGDVIATLYTNREEAIAACEKILLESTIISNEVPKERPLIFEKVI